MLTGDKLETATCIAKSSRLVARIQATHIFMAYLGMEDDQARAGRHPGGGAYS